MRKTMQPCQGRDSRHYRAATRCHVHAATDVSPVEPAGQYWPALHEHGDGVPAFTGQYVPAGHSTCKLLLEAPRQEYPAAQPVPEIAVLPARHAEPAPQLHDEQELTTPLAEEYVPAVPERATNRSCANCDYNRTHCPQHSQQATVKRICRPGQGVPPDDVDPAGLYRHESRPQHAAVTLF